MIYISHPFGNKEENKQDIERIVRELVKDNPKETFISPVHALGFLYADTTYEDGLNMCLELLSVCEKMYVYGDYENSRGCMAEIEFCRMRGIPYQIK